MGAGPFEDALVALRHRRERAIAELRRLNRLIKEIEAEANSLLSAASPPRNPEPAPFELSSIAVRHNEFQNLSYADACLAILRRGGFPITTRNLLPLLADGGKAVQGQDPYRVLYRSLMKHPAFKSTGGFWELVEWTEPNKGDLLTTGT
ncbi:MAG TPA: hypothetical protein VFA59_11235 [Vicinamibacterales bacterium]|nr:hypothetical protein [Vicinamibacterales bacterium]